MDNNSQTNLLEKFSREQIAAAKRTVTVTTEIEGETFTNTYDGSVGLVVLVTNGTFTDGEKCGTTNDFMNFAVTMLKDIVAEEPIILPILARALLSGDEDQPKMTVH